MIRRTVLAFLSLAFLYLAGSLASAGTRTFVDAAGRKVEIPEIINKAMAAGPPAAVLIYALAPEKLAGWIKEPSSEDKAFIPEPYRDLPAHGRLTGKGNTANLEAVLAMKPDIIIDVGTVDPTYASLADRVQEQTGIPYVLIDGSFAGTSDTLKKAGDLLGKQADAEKLAAYAQSAIERLNAIVADIPADKRPRVYYGRGPDGLETGLAGSINTEVLGAVGAVNVAEAAGSGGLANVSLEQILSWNPEIILNLDKKFQASVMQDQAWSGINAVKDNKVYRAPASPFGWFDSPPGINRIMGVSWLTHVLYPDKAKSDLRAEVKDFYKLFYHVDVSDGQVTGLLANATPQP